MPTQTMLAAKVQRLEDEIVELLGLEDECGVYVSPTKKPLESVIRTNLVILELAKRVLTLEAELEAQLAGSKGRPKAGSRK